MRSKYGLDPRDVLRVITFALGRLELFAGAAHNVQSEALLLGTAMVESNLAHLQQVGGPALGLWQMEPRTHDDIVVSYIASRYSLRSAFDNPDPLLTEFSSAKLRYDLRYAAMMARVHYLRVPEALPAVDAEAMAAYWKRYYNTPLGKGTVAKAVPHFREAIKVVQGG